MRASFYQHLCLVCCALMLLCLIIALSSSQWMDVPTQSLIPPSAPRPARPLTYREFRDVTADMEDGVPAADYLHFIERMSGHQPRLLSFTNFSTSATATATHLAVPNVVHYLWFGPPLEMNFLNFLNLLSVHKFLKPWFIFIHGENAPSGPWWQKAITDIPNIYAVYRRKPATINGKVARHMEHYADVARLEILLEYGGIYLDWDVLVVKSFDPLRKYDVTLGRETPSALANGIIVAKRSAPFLRIWLETYHTFTGRSWASHSTLMSHRLWKIFPHLVHVEETSIVQPNWDDWKKLFYGHYPWQQNYCVHVWVRRATPPANSTEIANLNTTLGEVMRHVLYS